MKIAVNGAAWEVEPATTVAQLVESLTGSTAGRGVAVALNDEVVPRSSWAATALRDGDAVEAITAVPGG